MIRWYYRTNHAFISGISTALGLEGYFRENCIHSASAQMALLDAPVCKTAYYAQRGGITTRKSLESRE